MWKFFILIFLPIVIFYYVIKFFGLNFLKKIRELNKLKKYGKTTLGIIADYKIDKDPSGMKSYLPVVTYKISEREFEILLPYPLKEKPILGSNVTVHYDDQNPEFAVIDIERALFKNYLGIFFLIFIMILVIFFTIKSI